MPNPIRSDIRLQHQLRSQGCRAAQAREFRGLKENTGPGESLTLGHPGHHKDAEPLKRERFEVSKRTLGLEHPSTLNAMGNLAATLVHLGRHKDVEPLERERLRPQSEDGTLIIHPP